MKMLIWLTQLGLSVAAPLAVSTLLAVWLQQRFDLGAWVVLLGIGFGLYCAVDGFRASLKIMERLEKADRKKDDPAPLSFNDHQ